ncbi:MAG: ribbon-helix-helix protein, CopG family [Nitrososphaera sp.]|nr:ribbon-helix-helix protein, CopG family [Nitrososphaera sp.]
MYTTIKISEELKKRLDEMKLQESESYAEIIEDLIEDRLSLNPDFIKEIEERRKEYKKGKTVSLEELKKGL